MADLRERKKAALRGTIVRKAVELFTERGYDAVSVDEIVAASMCSRSTFTRYFGTKEDVLFPGSAEVRVGVRAALDRVDPSEDLWQAARASMTESLVAFVENFDEDLRERCLRLWLTESAPRRRYLEFAFEWEQMLADFFIAHTPGAVDDRVRFQLLASAMASALRTAMHAAIELGEDVATTCDQAFTLLERGLGEHALWVAAGRFR